jgi:formylmethanofuran dehydrogenase subunit D
MPNQSRQLRIHRKYSPRARHKYVPVPEIRLSGNWLHDLGFKEGKEVKVAIKKGQLIVTLAKTPKP